MTRFEQDVFIAAGLRTPFGRGGGPLSAYDAIGLSVPVVLANIAALEKPRCIAGKTGIAKDFGRFPRERVNPNGGSVAIGHPFAATGARDLSQAVKELWAMPVGSRAIVSVCADGGEGTVSLLERV